MAQQPSSSLLALSKHQLTRLGTSVNIGLPTCIVESHIEQWSTRHMYALAYLLALSEGSYGTMVHLTPVRLGDEEITEQLQTA
ncbi:hypothetical protein DUNSADRAFT_16033 [Dunaliella salina]|uniref:Uncharacterized protein n=1 Tax=Dunaliella salina TaxID=3046 RepID=A0ABQ7G4C4_DUNSA|nr:hypothetical protein DUNSADRAFT_16033 [Dunaliella salina]|eukprot:KAF5829470.1 hypothetical protein DUNSADRAFT_16033 [Dunaliella salina]